MSDDLTPTEAEMLRQEVAALTVTLAGLGRELKNVLTSEQAREIFPTREENRKVRRRVAMTILSSVVLALILAIGGDNYAIRTCFLGSSAQHRPGGFCNVLFPGFDATTKESQQRLAQFNDLLAAIPANRHALDVQAREIARLQHEVAVLQRRVAGH